MVGTRILSAILLSVVVMMAGATQVHAASAPEERMIRANDVAFRTLRWNGTNGKTVLLLHGFPQNADTWRPVGDALADQGYTVLAFDQRGADVASLSKDPKDYTFDQFVSDALAVADASGVDKFHVVGFGWGGAMTWMIAARHPERVLSLTTLRYPHPAAFVEAMRDDPAQREAWQKVASQIDPQNVSQRAVTMLANHAADLRKFLSTSGLPDAFVDLYVKRLSQDGVLFGGLSWAQAFKPDEFLAVPDVRVPALYIWSDGPGVSRQALEASRRHALGGLDVVELDGVGHFMLETSPQRVAPVIVDFVKKVDARHP